ncbi:bifunctional tetrahydrofolate synthase/dihydrofolate synthase [Burkholderia stagnalis]|uniref:bifunctional tetrahydrofolate synthase/dihydrofolate synthase n=1 Tax=Burkholderia stagnalis TaxID=1503054 RepID=UPI00075B3973|nr:bifunctional tetrahydrofolate synthase/dihydrofolate synthase [Burkholderia stagnalis]KVC57958.1 bifunctional folylpolyglutamate synthase/dihydrofolate synthase [Burkholderia stagnalis]KVN19337.1 bifunctional folylpolyglutamate synthase/dihydrofolate synthase [Burkholderia stagnalis]KWI67577.1 bifunctional folylpolyglutamate synthase/dihydrofolate synthase [Burkholderia stagnalis]KWK61675.1 bifunctional folylpolyglutamate synthase/dihydrofolate synthase [Burkholderia stagnalis]KWN19153.1 bi
MSTFPTLDAWLSHLERAHPVGIDMGLARIGQVKAALGLEFACPVITVGGTNGKGSTCAFLETILVRAGYKVGCHTSPHLLEFNERARVNGQTVTDDELLPHFEAVEAARTSLPEPVSLTYFEFTTLAILHLFASRGLDAVILEVGLGGRLDAVNIIDTDCAIVTSIDIDHTEYLGDTREQIAFEKAGIFRPGKPAICGDPAAPQTLVDHAEAIGADLWLVGRDFRYEAQPGAERQQWSYLGRDKRYPALAYPALRGANQLINASAALAALESLRAVLPVSAQDIRLGLANVELPGRFQVLPGKPAIVLDVAHNPHAAAVLAQNLGNMGFFPYTYAVFGAMHDKDIDGVLQHLKGEIDHWCVTDLPLPRAASAEQLEAALRHVGVEDGADSSVTRYTSPADAFRDALKRASENDRIVVFGSFHTVAGVMAYRKSQQH